MSVSHQLYWYMESEQADIPVWKVFLAAAERARQQNSVSEVESLYRKAIKLARRSLAEPQKEIGGILLRLADFQLERKDYEAAGATYKSAVEALEGDDCSGSILLVAALSRLADVYELSGDGPASEATRQRIKQMLSDQLKGMVED
jgi:tetratricopeptide (TPR) repeat protein